MRTILRPSGEKSFLRDALRDLIVVVAGILAALWLESWWQGLQDRQEEQQILFGLRDEFDTNADDLEALLKTWVLSRQGILDTHERMGGPVNDERITNFKTVLTRRDADPGGRFFFDPRHGQLTSLINSGKLGLVSDPDLRSMLADWPALVADHDFDEKLWINNYQNRVMPVFVEYLGAGPESKFEGKFEELMMSRELEGYILGQAGLVTRMINEGREVLAVTREIVQRIDTELKSR